ncbi:MAG: carbohydrate kinase family protein, partial [Chloroflexi bacterium]|nr:carbohydrate kinase family protein [Chloroflexota bacterium]
ADASVDTTGLLHTGKTTGSELIYDANGNKEIRYPSKADPIKASDIPEAFRNCRLMYICTMDNDVTPEDIPAVVALGEVSAVDLGGYGGVHMSKANRAACPDLAGLANGVAANFNVVKASDEDAIAIFGWDDPDRAAQIWLDGGSDVAVITAGSKGALIYTTKGKTIVPPLPIKAIDTTGGGDTFMAGFLSEYLRSSDPIRSGQWGSATAACVIQKTGGVTASRMPTFDDVKAYVDRYYIPK